MVFSRCANSVSDSQTIIPSGIQDKVELATGTRPAGSNGEDSRPPYIVPPIREAATAQ